MRFTVVPLLALAVTCLSTPSNAEGIDNIEIANVSSFSCTVSWTTTDSTDACVRYGLTPALGDTICDLRDESLLHYADLTGLEPDTTYFFEVASGADVDDNEGNQHSFHTSEVGIGVPYTIWGNMEIAPDWTIVAVTVTPNAGSASDRLSVLMDSVGVWSLNLGNLKDPATYDVFPYAAGDSINISARVGPENVFEIDTVVAGVSPQYCGLIATAVRDTPRHPGLSRLVAHPNPFYGSAVLEFETTGSSRVSLALFDPSGREILTLIDSALLPAGTHNITLDGRGIPAGSYFARLRSGVDESVTKLVLLK